MTADIKPVAWCKPGDVDCLAFEDGHTWPGIFRHETDEHTRPLFDQQAIDSLRAEVERLRSAYEGAMSLSKAELFTRAERAEAEAASLREAIQDAANRIMGRAKWEPCDCGCNSDKPADAVSVAYVRAASMARAALQERGE